MVEKIQKETFDLSCICEGAVFEKKKCIATTLVVASLFFALVGTGAYFYGSLYEPQIFSTYSYRIIALGSGLGAAFILDAAALLYFCSSKKEVSQSLENHEKRRTQSDMLHFDRWEFHEGEDAGNQVLVVGKCTIPQQIQNLSYEQTLTALTTKLENEKKAYMICGYRCKDRKVTIIGCSISISRTFSGTQHWITLDTDLESGNKGIQTIISKKHVQLTLKADETLVFCFEGKEISLF